MRIIEEQCRGLEAELARVRAEVLRLIEERGQSHIRIIQGKVEIVTPLLLYCI